MKIEGSSIALYSDLYRFGIFNDASPCFLLWWSREAKMSSQR